MRKTKKILIITGWFPNEFEPSKCVFTKKIVEAQLQYTDCEITVICPAPYFPKINLSFIPTKFKNYSKLKYFYQNEAYKVYYPKYLKLPSPLSDKLDWFSFYKAIQKTIHREKLEFDLIHSHGIFPDSYAAALISAAYKKPLVVHVHDTFLDLIYKKHPKQVEYILNTATSILPVSQFQSKVLQDTVPHLSLEKKMTVIYNGVDLNLFKPNMTANESKSPVFRIAFIGIDYRRKGLKSLLSATSTLKDKHKILLDVIGDDVNKPEFATFAQHLNISNILTFKGNISNEKLSKLLPDYNLLVLPSEFETFGIVIIEAMACGIPVIATNISAMPEIVSNDEVGSLFNLGNIEELTRAIEKAISKQWNKQVIHDHAMKFSLVETVKNIDTVYNKLL